MPYRKDWADAPQVSASGNVGMVKTLGRRVNLTPADVGTPGNTVGAFTVPAGFVVTGVLGVLTAMDAGPDIVAPVLSSPNITGITDTTATAKVTTNEANGTLYMVVTTSTTNPSKAQIKAGQDNTGAAVAAGLKGNQAVLSAGEKSFSVTGLTASTTYYAYFMHEDAAANQSSIATVLWTASAPVAPATPGLIWASPSTDATPDFDVDLPSGYGDGRDALVGDVLRLERSSDGGSSWSAYLTDTLDAGDLVADVIHETASAVANGSYLFRARLERAGPLNSSYAQVAVTIAAAAATTTWNPSDKDANVTPLTNGNLTYGVNAHNAYANIRSVASFTSGLKYWEMTANVETLAASVGHGLGNSSADLSNLIGLNNNAFGWDGGGNCRINASVIASVPSWTQGDVLGFAVDRGNNKLWCVRIRSGTPTGWNNDILANQNPATNTGGINISAITGALFALGGGIQDAGGQYTGNFGGSTYAATTAGIFPSGYGNL